MEGVGDGRSTVDGDSDTVSGGLPEVSGDAQGDMCGVGTAAGAGSASLGREWCWGDAGETMVVGLGDAAGAGTGVKGAGVDGDVSKAAGCVGGCVGVGVGVGAGVSRRVSAAGAGAVVGRAGVVDAAAAGALLPNPLPAVLPPVPVPQAALVVPLAVTAVTGRHARGDNFFIRPYGRGRREPRGSTPAGDAGDDPREDQA